MNKQLPCFIVLLFILSPGLTDFSFAVPASPDMFDIVQPDGMVFRGRLSGDEWNNRVETIDGYTIKKHKNGFWEYISHYDDDTPVLSGIRAHKEPPAGIHKRVRPHKRFLRTPGRGMPAPSGQPLSSAVTQAGYPAHSGAASLLGTFNGHILFILAEFTDMAGTYPEEGFATFITDNINDYFSTASYGNVTLSPANESSGIADNGVVNWVNVGYAHPNTGGSIEVANQQLAKDAVMAADPYINYALYDSNGDGLVHSSELAVVVVAAGYERAFNTDIPNVWAHKWDLDSIGAPVVDGVIVGTDQNGGGGYVQFGEMHGSHQATMGVVVHELGHLIFGLPDLYDTDFTSHGIGVYGVMGSGSWGKGETDLYNGERPVLPCAWTKFALGWASPSVLSGNVAIVAAGAMSATGANTSFKLPTALPNEYFMVENRQALGYDRGLERWLGTDFGGLAIWHIDENTISSKIVSNTVNEVECYPGGPSCAVDHYGVALVQADSQWHLEKFENRGNASDLWYPGNGDSFDASSLPDSNLYDGSASNVSITNISDSDSTMTATVTYMQYQLTTYVRPSGKGGISPDCSEGCLYDTGITVVLMATPNSGNFFDHWSGCDSSSDNICTETMDTDKSVTANFRACFDPVRINDATAVYYSSLQDAYDVAGEGDIIQSRDTVFTGSLNANRPISITLEGGYNCDYSAVTGSTNFNAEMTISDGVVMIENFIFE
jgi:M6 family metalloprotease-like protein